MKSMTKTFPFVFSAVVLSLTAASCSSTPKSTRSASDERSSEKAQAPLNAQVLGNDSFVIKGLKVSQSDYDFPISGHERVEFWVDYFTGRGRKHFEKYLERSELFVPFIRPILKQYGLPQDLVYLAMIESGFHNHARSSAKAVGPWQFMPFTGRRFGLRVDWWVDERRDTEKSTHSAAKYLRELYRMFDSWELAASAYNSGEMKIVRAIQRYGTADYWSLTRQNFLRRETRDYVPKIMAAAIVAKNRVYFGFNANGSDAPKSGVALAPDGTVVQLEAKTAQEPAQATQEALESVLKSEATPGNASEIAESESEPEGESEGLVVGKDIEVVSQVVEHEKTPGTLARSVPTPHVNKQGELVGEELAEFEVQSPADLTHIASAADLSYHTVKSLNPELLRWCTPPGTSNYRVRLPVSAKERFLANYNSPEFRKRTEFLTFRVNRPQSLQAVARHFGIKVDPLADLNGLSKNSQLRKGALIRLPMPADGGRSVATLEIRDPPERRRRARASRVKRKKSAVSSSSKSSSRSMNHGKRVVLRDR